MSRGHLMRQFLDLDVLKRIEFRGPRRHEELSLSVVGFTFSGTFDKRTEFTTFNFLEDFGAAAVTGVRLDFDGRFDVRNACHDTADSDQVAQLCALDVSDCKSGSFLLVYRGSHGFDVQVTGVSGRVRKVGEY